MHDYQIEATEKTVYINSRKCMGRMRPGVCKHQKKSTVCNLNFKPPEKKKLTLCPNSMVLAVSPLWRGDGPIVTINEVLAVPVI